MRPPGGPGATTSWPCAWTRWSRWRGDDRRWWRTRRRASTCCRSTRTCPTLVTGWDLVGEDEPDWPHLDELQALAHGFATLPDARHFVHADGRDDNFLLVPGGRPVLCDWNWPALGPRWLDVVMLLVSAHGDGRDAEALLATNPLTADAPDEEVDSWLAALCGFMAEADRRPVPTSSPSLGVHRRWWAAACWSWLAQRRGWT